MRILALETSCDETAAAVLEARPPRVLSSVIASQIEVHRPYGGVVPELASRNHLVALRPTVEAALAEAGCGTSEIDAFAATAGPGLASALLVGNSAAKALALANGKPFVSVNHLEGHLLSPFLDGGGEVPPHLGLVVSGGHTLLVDVKAPGDYTKLGTTRDDAAGEAFDKVGKMLGLPYPGGPEIDRIAAGGDPKRFDLPRSMLRGDELAFSFSGLKTAVLYLLPKIGAEDPADLSEQDLADLCASFQAAVVDVLVHKALLACRLSGRDILAVSGGVSCNSGLRTALDAACAEAGISLQMAAPALTTDNAAMIAFAALHRLQATGGEGDPLDRDVDPNLTLA